MKRGEIWTLAGSYGYGSKPRPALIVQDDSFDSTASITVCPFTSDPTDIPLFRLPIEPDEDNALRKPCSLMVDKIITVERSKLGKLVGRLGDEDITRLNRAMLVFLGLAAPGSRRRSD